MSSRFHQPDKVTCNGELFKIFITKEQIDERLAQMGRQLNKDFDGKRPIFIGILNGAFIFLADIMRHVTIPCEVDFMKLSSYGDEKVSSGQVTELKHIDAKIEGRHVILIEDIVDTGLSMQYMVKRMKEENPASVSVCTLLHKKEATRHDVQLDYVGFEIPDAFVLGYGLDYAQEGRNLSQIYVLDDEK
ncbi:hypoxanthine phosphoribosyltransferase [Gracilimonas mengyeensis]|uniref:Hypoxanthine phosphoribosyltransferase n=1 Tax=Gracilimonas mengyeensis TaxID=1302730 RepID=A0A521CCZ0_9BACT|nr:hypoxanthine phosphoribosyltransferase [Gracilimonas mengyeensis]SMO57283.1 hypoxanthine phosphoribosyltransferase [Gracilimonas mengyeensis]